ncbi:DNA repair protein RAD51 homolog 4 [Clupea harengus]|uniref:DNA repair protein RAD51 homolog 4 n=1 Tax=Clupea harengus TaxID=7950 RepID=A0A6P8FW27_CLUHA|nr:DNA repair protein RAD51 homolog 4 [Clupea harengus]XP_031427382.1 DNA repair protein RAD51 homolog 4 [Clupea harengus]
MVVLREGICPGLNQDLVQALRNVDIRTVEDLVSANLEELAQKCSVSYKALIAVRRVLLAQHAAFPVSCADLYEELLSSTAILSTGNHCLDKLLDSGLYTGEVTELIGGPGSGKTQVCFSTAVHISCQLKQSVVYIDTNGGMSANRMLQMLQAKTSTMEEQMAALQRIQVFRVFDVFSLLKCLQNISAGEVEMACVGTSVKALILDSVSAVLSNMLGGKQTEGMSLMMQVAGELKTISKDLSVAVLVTNHATRDGSGQLRAGLGQSWSHVPRTRVLLHRVKRPGASSGLRLATLTKSSRQSCQVEEEFDLSGWRGPEDTKAGYSGKRKLECDNPGVG